MSSKDVILNEVGMFGELDLEDPTEIDITDKKKKKTDIEKE